MASTVCKISAGSGVTSVQGINRQWRYQCARYQQAMTLPVCKVSAGNDVTSVQRISRQWRHQCARYQQAMASPVSLLNNLYSSTFLYGQIRKSNLTDAGVWQFDWAQQSKNNTPLNAMAFLHQSGSVSVSNSSDFSLISHYDHKRKCSNDDYIVKINQNIYQQIPPITGDIYGVPSEHVPIKRHCVAWRITRYPVFRIRLQIRITVTELRKRTWSQTASKHEAQYMLSCVAVWCRHQRRDALST